MIILGLNINHADTSACIIVNGKIIAAIEEERFVRKKHYAGFPLNSIEFCLSIAKLTINDVNFITVNYSPTSNLKQKVNKNRIAVSIAVALAVLISLVLIYL